MKVAAVHFDAAFADIDENYKRAEEYIKEAKENEAEYIALPEFFTTGMAISNQLMECIVRKEDSSQKLKQWANKYQISIGGSYLFYDGLKVQNTYCLACPNGEAFYHGKDVPTALEGLYYEAGDQKKVASGQKLDVGICMCWEMMRYDTIREMQGKVNLVMVGSCWWDLAEQELPDSMRFMKDYSRQQAMIAPVRLAKFLHVPVIHASHKGRFTGVELADQSKLVARDIVGATQIVDENGRVLAKKDWTEEPGVIYAEIQTDKMSTVTELPDQYWISLPQEFTPYWNQVNQKCNAYYRNVTIPYCRAH